MPYHHQLIRPTIAALAGRRIDAPHAHYSRFPPAEAEHVASKLYRRFGQEQVTRLICSAACGADILALEAAEKLAIPATIVLPFTPSIFRALSVTDRPGDWGERFDYLVAAARNHGDLVELELAPEDTNAFAITNDHILQLTNTAPPNRRLAFVVWEGRARVRNDITADFLNKALALGFEKRTVLTLRRAL